MALVGQNGKAGGSVFQSGGVAGMGPRDIGTEPQVMLRAIGWMMGQTRGEDEPLGMADIGGGGRGGCE